MKNKAISINALDGHKLSGYLAHPQGTPKGGVIVLTVKGALWEAGFEAALRAQPVDLLEVTAPYLSMPGDPATTPSRAVAVRVR